MIKLSDAIKDKTQIHCVQTGDDVYTVLENTNYRWLCFDTLDEAQKRDGDDKLLQSMMSQSNPAELVLPYLTVFASSLNLYPNVLTEAKRVLLLGLGGGDMMRYLRERNPGLSVQAVELSETVVDLARRFFGLSAVPKEDIQVGDGFKMVRSIRTKFDFIFADMASCYASVVQLTQRDFYHHCIRRLTKTGLLVVNLLCSTTDELLPIATHIRKVFGGRTLLFVDIPGGNQIMLAFKEANYSKRIIAAVKNNELPTVQHLQDWGWVADFRNPQ